MSESSELKVALDVGLSARASLEAKVSTEIPAQSSGRLLDAFTDIIRPFSERRGLKADQIRLQREDVLIEIAQKARLRMEIEHQIIQPLPNKFLVPFLEKASLEELGGGLVDRWADLLVSCSVDPSAAHPRFVQILSELTEGEAKLLRSMALDNIDNVIDKDTQFQDPSYAYQPSVVVTLVKELLTDDINIEAEYVMGITTTFLDTSGIKFLSALMVKHDSSKGFQYPRPAQINPTAYDPSLGILQSLDLVKTYNAEVLDDVRFDYIRVSYAALTSMGVSFLRKCDREVDEAIRSSTHNVRKADRLATSASAPSRPEDVDVDPILDPNAPVRSETRGDETPGR